MQGVEPASRSYVAAGAGGRTGRCHYNFISRARFAAMVEQAFLSGPTCSAAAGTNAADAGDAGEGPGRRAGHRRPGRAAGSQPRESRRYLRAATLGGDPEQRPAAAARIRRRTSASGSTLPAARSMSSRDEYVVVNDETEAAVDGSARCGRRAGAGEGHPAHGRKIIESFKR